MNTKFPKLLSIPCLLLLLLTITVSPIFAQPVGGAGRSVVPGTHFILSDADGSFTPSNGATWINGDGWQVQANEDGIRTPTFNLEHLKTGNLKWYVRTYSANSSYIDFAEFYGSTPGVNSGNFYSTTAGTVETYSGDLDNSESFTEFSLLISKAAFIMNPPEPDNYPVLISEFWIEVDDATLPVKLVRFKAERQEKDILLSWATVSESNNQGFQIERSRDGRQWNKIGFVDAASENGNSIKEVNYNFVDNKNHLGETLYRLKQIDIDGSHQYSTVRQVKFDLSNQLVVYPNPSVGNITLDGLTGIDKIVLLDVTGRIVKAAKGYERTTTLSLDGLQKGAYYIQVVSKDQVIASKLINKN